MYANNGSMCTIIATITNLTPFYNPHNSEMSLKAQDKEDKNVTLIQNNIKMILIWDAVHESNDSGNGCGRWDFPRPGIEFMSPALAGGFLTTEPPGKPNTLYLTSILFLITLLFFS